MRFESDKRVALALATVLQVLHDAGLSYFGWFRKQTKMVKTGFKIGVEAILGSKTLRKPKLIQNKFLKDEFLE